MTPPVAQEWDTDAEMSILRAVRPPRPVLIRQIEPPTHAPAAIELIVAANPRSALRRLTASQAERDVGTTPGLIHITRSASGALASALLENAPPGTHINTARGARNLAGIGPGLHNGWARLELPVAGFQLDAVYLPTEFARVPVIVLPGAADADAPAQLWIDVVHPHTALRIRASGKRSELLAEALLATCAMYVLPLKHADPSARRFVAVTADVVAAQLIRLAGERLAAASDEPETVSPWEDAVVQAATQLGLGPARGDQLALIVRDVEGVAGTVPDRLAELLSCRVAFADQEHAVE